ncbi:hypothetical protein ACK3YP_02535 [Aeromonas allosaccharophila]|uniref:hypothetical protein n=1 Tax=Aeromonas allosaccharophila TaxID=656 RepID=UPI003987DDFF
MGIFIGIAYMLRMTWLTVDEDHQHGILGQLYQMVGECEPCCTTLYRGVSLYSSPLSLCNVSLFVVIVTPPWCSTKQDLNRVESRLSFRWYFVLQEGSVLGLGSWVLGLGSWVKGERQGMGSGEKKAPGIGGGKSGMDKNGCRQGE